MWWDAIECNLSAVMAASLVGGYFVDDQLLIRSASRWTVGRRVGWFGSVPACCVSLVGVTYLSIVPSDVMVLFCFFLDRRHDMSLFVLMFWIWISGRSLWDEQQQQQHQRW
jgi:hypothetical protein